MIATQDQRVLVLRSPEEEGNFIYRLAELRGDESRRLAEVLTRGEAAAMELEMSRRLSDPLTLPQVMEKLQSRDFQVVDLPASH